MSLQEVRQTIQVEPVEGEERHELVARRIERCSDLGRKAADRCLKLLIAAQRDAGDDRELLEELVLFGLAWPKLVLRHGYELVGHARRLGELRLLDGDAVAARAVLERAADLFPDHRGLERDLIVVLRELDDVEALAQRCMRRAQAEIDGGKPMEAIPWLQEVLVSDPARRDVARLIRDLRFREAEGRRRRRRFLRGSMALLGVFGVVAALGWREVDLRQRYAGLPAADLESRASVELRLGALDAFATAHPIWHGTLELRAEQTQLRTELERLVSTETVERELAEERRRRAQIEAELLLNQVEQQVEYFELDAAEESLERALELGGPDWERRARVEADLAAVRELRDELEVGNGEDRR
ncbi:MAG: hypothetical protein AAFZ65_13295 [Planctomycetota bacterium]